MNRHNQHKRTWQKSSSQQRQGGWWLRYWDKISTSFWALPSLIVLLACLAAVLLTFLEIEGWLPLDWLRKTDADQARQILATVAAASISVAGVTFSIVMVVLTLASSQLGPRLVRSFIHDRANQLVLGIFVATFAYCILLLGLVGSYNDSVTFIPRVSLAVAVALAIVDIGVFIFFIHHLAVAIQSPQVIQRVGGELDTALDQCFNGEPSELSNEQPPDSKPKLVRSLNNGYVHGIDIDYLLKICEARELQAECLVEVGEFVLFSTPLLKIWPNSDSDTQSDESGDDCDEETAIEFLSGVLLASQRSPIQDPTFAMGQLVEIAVRSLSPGINDPFTAMNAANRMAAALVRIDRREAPQSVFGEDSARLWLHWRSKADYVDTMFAAITEYADCSALVNQHLLSLCDRLLARLEDKAMRKRVGDYADIIIEQLNKSPLPVTDSDQKLRERIKKQLNGQLNGNDGDAESSADTGTTGD